MMHRGSAAAGVLFEAMKVLVAEGDSSVNMQALTPLHVFGWLLNAQQQCDVKSWTDAEFLKGGGDVSGPGRAATVRGRQKSNPSAATKLALLLAD